MSNKPVRRPRKPTVVQQPQYIPSFGIFDSLERLGYGIWEEHQRAKRRSRILGFFLGALACLSLWLFMQNLNRTPDFAQQPGIQRFDSEPLQPVSNQPRKGKPVRRNKESAEKLQAAWQ